MEWDEYQAKVKKAELKLIAVEGVVHDASDFTHERPGGMVNILSRVGKDGTASFNGGVYDHSNAARNLLAMKRIAKLRGGGEVEMLKRKRNIPVV